MNDDNSIVIPQIAGDKNRQITPHQLFGCHINHYNTAYLVLETEFAETLTKQHKAYPWDQYFHIPAVPQSKYTCQSKRQKRKSKNVNSVTKFCQIFHFFQKSTIKLVVDTLQDLIFILV